MKEKKDKNLFAHLVLQIRFVPNAKMENSHHFAKLNSREKEKESERKREKSNNVH